MDRLGWRPRIWFRNNSLQGVTGNPFSGTGEIHMSVVPASWKSMPKTLPAMLIFPLVILLAVAMCIPNLQRSRTAAEASARWARAHQSQFASSPLTESGYGEEGSLHQEAPRSLPAAGLPTSGGATAAADKSSAPNAPSASAARKLVRTGALALTVKSPADAAEQIRVMAESLGGYLEAAQIGGTKEAPIAEITIRVPAAQFEDMKAGIRKLAARVESEKTDAQDVTRQYVDMEARLRNLRAEEAQYLAIMKSAYKVDDLLEVSEKLSQVRGQIEQQQAEFQTLSKQVETVAITISLRALTDAKVFGLNWRPLYQLKVAARDGLAAMADYTATIVAVLFYVPVALAWSFTLLFAALMGWRLIRWTGRRFFDWPEGAPGKAAHSI
jgi:cell division septum initiation protein DivIVA